VKCEECRMKTVQVLGLNGAGLGLEYYRTVNPQTITLGSYIPTYPYEILIGQFFFQSVFSVNEIGIVVVHPVHEDVIYGP
jgi:hypothetical protein